MPSYEDLLRQNVGMPIQNQANQMGQQADQMAQQKLQALHALSAQQTPPPQPMAPPPQPPPQQPEAQPNSPTMSPADQQTRMQALTQAPLTMQQVAAKLRAQADEDAAHQASMNADEDDVEAHKSEYKDYPSKFDRLKSKLNSSDEDDDKNTRGSTRDTGTSGGI
jgi:cell pole-organizing protein PopZ